MAVGPAPSQANECGLRTTSPISIHEMHSIHSDDERVFRLSSYLPSATEEGRKKDERQPSYGLGSGGGETYVALQQKTPSPPVELGDFGDLWDFLKQERVKAEAKLRAVRVVSRTDKPDIICIPSSAPTLPAGSPAKGGQNATGQHASCDSDTLDLSPLRDALATISSSPKTSTLKAATTELPADPASATIASSLPKHIAKAKTRKAIAAVPKAVVMHDGGASSWLPAPSFAANRYARADYEEEVQDRKPRSALPIKERAASLLQKMTAQFPGERAVFGRAEALGAMAPPEGTRPLVYVFTDFSNIHIGFLDWCRAEGYYNKRFRRPKLDLHSLFAILERGRSPQRRILVGSRPLSQGLEAAEEWRYELHILDRVQKRQPPRRGFNTDSGSAEDSDYDGHHRAGRTTLREQAVDEVLTLKLYETVTRPPSEQQRQAGRPVIVLASGDGNRGEYSEEGFIAPVRLALAGGFDVELFSFRAGLSTAWKSLQQEHRRTDHPAGKMGTLKITTLDTFGDELVA